MSRRRQSRAALVPLAMLLLTACSAVPIGGTGLPDAPSPIPSSAISPEPVASASAGPSATSTLPLCNDVGYLSAPAEYYRDSPIYVANEMHDEIEQLRVWARGKPGFQDLWIDRDHHGWITMAFTENAAARQAELEAEFPGVGVVAVQGDWTVAELEALQRRIADTYRGRGANFGSGIYPNKGVVSIEFGILWPELVAEAGALFSGEPVCVSGMDPAYVPVEGPQQPAGDGWTLIADKDETGAPYRTDIAYDETSYSALWDEAGLTTARPAVDFQSQVVIWFGAVHGSSCPRLRLDDVVVDEERALVYSEITYLDVGTCTGDAIGHAYVVTFDRSRLPVGAFAIQLQSEQPSPGVISSRTIVEVDLSAPGSTAGPGKVHPDTSEPEPYSVGPGGFIEDGFETNYHQPVKCGLEWLGPLNDTYWHTDEADGTADWMPRAWRESLTDGEIELEVLITVDPPRLKATANGQSVHYEATIDEPPTCP